MNRKHLTTGLCLIAFLVFVSAIISTAQPAPTVRRATGRVFWLNPPEKLGKIRSDDDEPPGGRTYNFQIPQDLDEANKDYAPEVDDHVNFTPGPGNTATGISKIDDPDPDPDPDPPPER